MVASFRKLLYLRFVITEVGIYNSQFLFIPIVCNYLKRNVINAPVRSSLILTKTVNFMNLKAIFLCFFILLFSASHAQSLKPKSLVENARSTFQQVEVKLFNLSSERNSIKIPDEIKEYSILSIDKRAIQSLTQSRSPFISIKIPQNGRNDISLELVEVNPFSEDFILRTAPSMQIVSFNHGKHYRGIVKGQERSIAAISVFDDQIVGMISHPSATGNLVIGKLENAEQHILYQDDQIADKKKASCQTTDDMKGYTDEELRHSNTGTRALTDCVRLYLEVDYDIYTSKGSSVTNVNNYVAGIFNQVNTLYANEQIKTVVSEILVWTTPSPYNSTSSDGMLTAFGNQRQGFNGDLAMLLSYKASGGIAWVNGLCRTNPDYSMSYSGIQSTYQNVPTYSWTVEVCTHEFGHLFGSQHTHACVWNGNNTAIDGCYSPEGSCSNPGLPPAATGGTIMSYCHLTSVGIKFSNGFGTQPGNVMRNSVSAATCLQACNGGGGTQCNEVSLTLELRTDTYANETTWEIKNSTGVIVKAGGPYSSGNTLHNISLCLPAGCNYTFTIKDLYGDGICCAYGSGSYSLKQGINTIITGGQFGASETKSFCTTGSAASNLALSTATGSAGEAAGSASVGVTSNVSWTASSNATSWCTVTPASGSNNGTLSINYTANTTITSRSATVTVTGGGITKTYLLTQSGSTPAPNLNLSVTTGSAGAAAGSASVGVSSNVSWTASSNATSWCTVTSANGSNNGTLTVNYSANATTTSRSATVTVTGGGITKTYLLTQSGSTPAPNLNLSVTTGSAGAAAGSASVGVSSNVSWTASSNATSWCTVTSANGSNNGTLTVNYSANATTTSRSATITVVGGGITKTYILTQAGTAAPTCNDGMQNGNETGVDCGGSCSACGSCISIVLEIRTDQYPSEISWNIKNPAGAIVASGGNYQASHTVHTHPHCLPAGCYTLNLLDGYGDGILAPGYYKVTQGTTILVNNEAYELSKTVDLCVGSNNNPQLALSTSTGSVGAAAGVASVGVTSNVTWTASSNATSWCTVTPANGSNNGNLSVNYSANATTTSRSATITVAGGGITKTYILTQAGTAAPTCNDGIQNGNETGVDCGGSCAPCSSGGPVVMAGNYFETGWDGWIDGGSDCFRYQGSFSPEGQYSIRIRDNSGSESTMTSPVYNLTPYSSVSIEFKFRAVGMESGEDFWIRYFNGTTWSTVGTFISGSSFANNQLYTINITLTGQFPSNAQFSFQCDASENDDEVYIDAVIIKGNTGSNLIEEVITIKSENTIVLTDERINDMILSPNPADNMVKIKLSEIPKLIRIINMSGQLMHIPVDIEQSIIDVSALKSGIYFIQAETDEEVFTQKLIKI